MKLSLRKVTYSLACLLMSSLSVMYCHALTITVRADQENKLVKDWHYHPIEVSGQSYGSMSMLAPAVFNTQDSIVFHIHTAEDTIEEISGIPDEVMDRLKTLLNQGYINTISFLPLGLFNPRGASLGPACGCIMAYLLFGKTDFQTPCDTEELTLDAEGIYGVQALTAIIQPGSMIQVINYDYQSEPRDSYLYLGGNLFLAWEIRRSRIYIRSAAQIDERLPNKYSIRKVTGTKEPTQQQVQTGNTMKAKLVQFLSLMLKGEEEAEGKRNGTTTEIKVDATEWKENMTEVQAGSPHKTSVSTKEGPLFMTGHSL